MLARARARNAVVALAGAAVIVSLTAATWPTRSTPGLGYTIRVSSRPRGGRGLLPAGPGNWNWTGNVVVTGGRGRVDIVDGGAEGLFTNGDYMLFDANDFLIVRPSAKEYIGLPGGAITGGLEMLRAMPNMTVDVSELKVSMERVGVGDTIAGQTTQHYRLTSGYIVAIDAAFIQQAMALESTTDYWVANVDGLITGPFLKFFSSIMSLGGIVKEIGPKMDAEIARMGGAAPLKAVTVTSVSDGRGATSESEATILVSAIKRRDVDPALLVLPSDVQPANARGIAQILGGQAKGDLGAKWRAKP
jgi:hypothetical protein